MRAIRARGLALCALFIVVAVTLSACHDTLASGSLPTLTTKLTDTFTGTLTKGGSITNQITITAAAPVTLALTDVQPLTTMGLGVSLAAYTGTACSTTAIAKNDNSKMGATALTGTATSGTYCVAVYDSGNIPTDWTVTFTVQAVHY